MGPSKKPTKIEQAWMDKAAEHGCIACRKDGEIVPASIHHITSGYRRMGHLFTLPLCYMHHQGDGKQVPSVHGAKRSFVERYGSELELLAELQVKLGVYDKVIHEAC
jgi:Recombination enhancement, RecA-dependent nuclease